MSPLAFLALVSVVSAAAWIAGSALRRYGQRHLQHLARQWGMQYCREDRFRLTERVADRFPLPGAGDVRVVDVVYGAEGTHYRYIFTVEYTLGVVRRQKRARRVAAASEPREHAASAPALELSLAADSLSLPAQYRALAAREPCVS
jgi:hypothetical protein